MHNQDGILVETNMRKKKKDGKKEWSNIQHDLLTKIKSRLFAGDLAAFNAICKSWRSIIPKPYNFPLPVNSSMAHSPHLASLRDDVLEFYHPILNATYTMSTPELSDDASIVSSNDGWLLLFHGFDELFFFNPLTWEKIDLPFLSVKKISTMTFSCAPTFPQCIVIGIVDLGTANRNKPTVVTLRPGDSSWSFDYEMGETYYDDEDESLLERERFLAGDAYCSPFISNGKTCYFLGEMGIGKFNIKEQEWEEFYWDDGRTETCSPYAMVYDRGLMAVYLTPDCQVRVRRFNKGTKLWREVDRIPDSGLYVSSNGKSILDYTSLVSGMKNKIYFPIFHRGTDGVSNGIFYNMSTKKFRSYDGKYCSSEYPSNPRCSRAWIKPCYTMVENVDDLQWFTKD